MKRVFYLGLLVLTITVTVASKKAKENENTYKIEAASTSITWTAYKTTLKIPVSGTFKELQIENNESTASVYDALNGIKFSIPVGSIYSQSNLRDGKIKKYFFGKMLNTVKISGTINLVDSEAGIAEITMNNVSNRMPFTYKISGDKVVIDAIMDVKNWEAQAAIDALNDACEDLHTGPDGETVTWSEVKINVAAKLVIP